MRDVRQWLDSLGLDQYADAFERNAIELDQLATLSDEELKELGVSALGHRKRIREKALSQSVSDELSPEQHTSPRLAERIVASGAAADGERPNTFSESRSILQVLLRLSRVFRRRHRPGPDFVADRNHPSLPDSPDPA